MQLSMIISYLVVSGDTNTKTDEEIHKYLKRFKELRLILKKKHLKCKELSKTLMLSNEGKKQRWSWWKLMRSSQWITSWWFWSVSGCHWVYSWKLAVPLSWCDQQIWLLKPRRLLCSQYFDSDLASVQGRKEFVAEFLTTLHGPSGSPYAYFQWLQCTLNCCQKMRHSCL